MEGQMFRKHSRIIAAVVLSFFTWTSGGVFSVAHAAQDAAKKAKTAVPAQKAEGAEERFAKLTEELTADLNDPKAGYDSKKQRLTAYKGELDTLDADIRKQFAATEKKLKDAKLPAEILARHAKFVKHYDDNLAELKGNISLVERAKDVVEAETALQKTRKHLERTKTPSLHQKLDPNKLPHRQPKVIKREPRLKKEEFDKDLKKDKHAWKQAKRIMVASTGSVTGLLPSDDLAETVEVQLTPEIRAKALELGSSPEKIYEWVRNNIEFVPTWGSIQGAQMTLLTRQGNAFDTASLLIALLRAAGINARYVTGTVELPIDKVMNWTGGFTDPQAALNFIASGGIPVKGGLSGGKITKAQMEHVWVEAYLPYGNYRGTMRDQSNPTWIPLDASFKQNSIVPGFDVTAMVPFNQDNYLASLNSQNSLHFYQRQIQSYLDSTMPDKSIVDVKGKKEILEEKFKFLPSSLPYKTIVVANKASYVSANYRAKVSFRMSSSGEQSDVFYSTSAPELAGKRVTLSYRPATSSDEALVTTYGGFMFNVPAYMLQVKPELRVEGNVVLAGEPSALGNVNTLSLGLTRPDGTSESVEKTVVAGGYYAIGIDLAGVNEGSLGARNGTLRNNIATLPPEAFSNDDLIGEHLHLLAMTYFFANDKLYSSGAKIYNVAQMRTLSGSIVSIIPSVTYFFSIPRWVTPSGLEMDVPMDRIIAVAKDGSLQAEKSYMEMSGLISSFNEHYIFEAIDGFSSVSAVKALQTASQNGIAIYKINAANIEQIVPQLLVSQEVVVDIRNSVNAGNEITIPQRNVQINDWNGVGYIVKDPASGSGTYMISGGLAGGGTTNRNDGYQIVQLYKGAYGWVKDSLDAAKRNIIKLTATVSQFFEVLSDEDIGEKAAKKACNFLGWSYTKVGKCTGLVVKAYMAAGIDLVNLAKENDTGDPNYAPNLYNLANKLRINNSVRTTNDSLVGDIIFWNYTYDRDDSCNLSDDEQPTHVGIVTGADVDGKGTVTYIHAASKGVKNSRVDRSGVEHKLNMNIQLPSDTAYNSFLRGNPVDGCPDDGGTLGKLSGELFNGFGTIR